MLEFFCTLNEQRKEIDSIIKYQRRIIIVICFYFSSANLKFNLLYEE